MMQSKLNEIITYKRAQIQLAKSQNSANALLQKLKLESSPVRGFSTHLRRNAKDGTALICEIKKSSPSKGLIRTNFDPIAHAQAYEAAGASCLSILTEEHWFQGHETHLINARKAVQLPVLRKDFIVDSWQVIESRLMGADCILLIIAALEKHQAIDLEQTALNLGMDVLVEIHNHTELELAQEWLRADLLGINNRNLKTLSLSLDTSMDLLKKITPDRFRISESGIYTDHDIASLKKAGAQGFLVGSSLMEQQDIRQATLALLGTLPS